MNKVNAGQRLAAAKDPSTGDVLTHLIDVLLLAGQGSFQLGSVDSHEAAGTIRGHSIQLNAATDGLAVAMFHADAGCDYPSSVGVLSKDFTE